MDLDSFRRYTRWHAAANARRYRAPADPWRLVSVSPAAVDAKTNALPLNWGLGRVRGGDWDRAANRSPIRETDHYRGLREHFVDGVPWPDTAFYEAVAALFEEREQVRGYESLEAFREVRLAHVDALYDAIATDGYRANASVADDLGDGHDPADADNAFETAYANKLEPLVVVDRHGDVVWTEGYHRFVIADILDVDAVPVQVLCRHEEWQRVRDAVAEDGIDAVSLPDDVDPTHPDIADVLET